MTITVPQDHAPTIVPAARAAAVPTDATGADTRMATAGRYALGVTRIALGSVFLWAFVDKLIGLDHATPSARSWLNGGSPTTGFLKGVEGPFADAFHSMAGNRLMDVLFMVGLLGIGVALTAGIGMRVAAASATVMLVLMWAASLPIATNPFLDDHLVYALVIVGFALTGAGDALGFGAPWRATALVRRLPFLR